MIRTALNLKAKIPLVFLQSLRLAPGTLKINCYTSAFKEKRFPWIIFRPATWSFCWRLYNDDKKDAGELGSGHTVTALYEIIPVGVKSAFLRDIDPLKYQPNALVSSVPSETGTELLTIKFRYKAPDGEQSKLISQAVGKTETLKPSENFRFAAAVAELGVLLRDSQFKSQANFAQVIELAESARGEDKEGYRAEFIRLVKSIKW